MDLRCRSVVGVRFILEQRQGRDADDAEIRTEVRARVFGCARLQPQAISLRIFPGNHIVVRIASRALPRSGSSLPNLAG